MGMSRSEQMARVTGKDTKPERRLRSALWAAGLRYRLDYRILGRGRADLAFLGPKVAVFVDGCFWHGCPIHYTTPRTRQEYWGEKLAANVERDSRHTRALEDAGWMVLRFWEHEVANELDGVVASVLRAVRDGRHTVDLDWRVVGVETLDGGGDTERRHLVDLRNGRRCRTVTGKRNSR